MRDTASIVTHLTLCPYRIKNDELSVAVGPIAPAGVVSKVSTVMFRVKIAKRPQTIACVNVSIVAGLKYIKTETGSRLLADGWWGSSRHINYFGDWLLSLAMSLTTGEQCTHTCNPHSKTAHLVLPMFSVVC